LKKRPTLQDIAEAANVSTASVSNALTGRGRISEKKKQKIQEVAARIGYSREAKDHQKPKRVIGLLLHTTYPYLWPYFNGIIASINRILWKRRYSLVTIPIEYDARPSEVESRISASSIDGLFSFHYVDEDLFTRLEKSAIPVVVLNNGDYQSDFFTVTFDDLSGSYEATRYLLELGHTRIAYVDYAPDGLFAISRQRYQGYRHALEEAGMRGDRRHRISIHYENRNALVGTIRPMFEAAEAPTAIFAHDDYLAAHLFPALSELGLNVPRDISIVAPGDLLDYDDSFCPQITTVRINTTLLGKVAAELMVSRFEDQPTDIQVLKVREQLTRRNSCASPLQSAEKLVTANRA